MADRFSKFSELLGLGARKTFPAKFYRAPGIVQSDGGCQNYRNKLRLAEVVSSEIRFFKTFNKISKKEASPIRRPPSGWRPPI